VTVASHKVSKPGTVRRRMPLVTTSAPCSGGAAGGRRASTNTALTRQPQTTVFLSRPPCDLLAEGCPSAADLFGALHTEGCRMAWTDR
jgi:hypothetical protein